MAEYIGEVNKLFVGVPHALSRKEQYRPLINENGNYF